MEHGTAQHGTARNRQEPSGTPGQSQLAWPRLPHAPVLVFWELKDRDDKSQPRKVLTSKISGGDGEDDDAVDTIYLSEAYQIIAASVSRRLILAAVRSVGR